MAIVFNNRSLNVLSNDALIEQSSRRARAGIVSGRWRASPQNSSRSGLNIVEDGGRALSGSMTSPTNRLLRTRRRRQPRRIFGAVQTRLYGPWACVWTTLSSDVSKRAILPPRSRCCPNRKLYRALLSFLLCFAPDTSSFSITIPSHLKRLYWNYKMFLFSFLSFDWIERNFCLLFHLFCITFRKLISFVET